MTTDRPCIACGYERRVMQREVRENERLARAGKRADLTAIESAKQRMADCAARGHHDSAAALATARSALAAGRPTT